MRTTPAELERLLDLLAALAEWVRPLPEHRLPVHSRDLKDDRYLACALAAGADYLVTGDDDLLALAGEPGLGGLRILPPSAFLAERAVEG